MTAMPLDIDAYRRRIGFDDEATPTLATLERLLRLHASAIPFENIDVLAGRVPSLDIDSLERKMVHRARGGYCFEQNMLFRAVLRVFGFDVTGLEARVRAGAAADVVTGRTHMVLRVGIDGHDWLADVGFGGLAPTTPVRLDPGPGARDRVASYRVSTVDADLMLQVRTGDAWNDCYRITASRPEDRDYEVGNWFMATHPASMLGRNVLIGIAAPAGRLTLFNRTLTLRTPDGIDESTLHTRADFARVLAEDFRLVLDDSEVDAVMRAVERQDLDPTAAPAAGRPARGFG
jgi:N-hydroxyarylamine O-acetyltransferase